MTRCYLLAESIGEVEIFDIDVNLDTHVGDALRSAAKRSSEFLLLHRGDIVEVGRWRIRKTIHGLTWIADVRFNHCHVGDLLVLIEATPLFATCAYATCA